MKIIHCADIHLGSQMDTSLTSMAAKERRAELRASFLSLVDYARAGDIKHILLAGDIFDTDRPTKADRELFYNIIKGSPDISFYYLRGNHDLKEDYGSSGLDNLKTFSDDWSSYGIGEGVVIHGIELTAGNSSAFSQTLVTEVDKINIVMLHGQISSSTGRGLIHLPSLARKNIDYLALGHVHSYSSASLDARGIYAYSGCLEGRGFDECGERGFILLDTEDGKIKHSFIPFSKRRIFSYTVDVGDCDGPYSLLEKIRALGFGTDDIIRVTLVGECDFDLTDIKETITHLLTPHCAYARVKSKARARADISEAECELSLRGEFIRTVLSGTLSDDEKREVIELGLRALSGED